MKAMEIEIRSKRFPGVERAPPREVLRDVRLTVPQGEFTCILGPSGCGKTTLLNIVAGLDQDFDGRLALPTAAGQDEPAVGYVFQSPRLLPWLTVLENINLVLEPAQIHSGIVSELLVKTGLEEFQDTYPQRLSLGMSRRVALVRAFAVRPDLLLLDEPFASLDEPTAHRLRLVLLRIWNERPTTVLFVTHDIREAIMLAQRILLFTGVPAAPVADIAVDIDREARADSAAIEAFRQRLIRENPRLYAEL